MKHDAARVALRHSLKATAIGPYEDSIIDGLKVTQVETDNRRSNASIRGNRLLVKWGQDSRMFNKATQLAKWVRWANRKLGQKKERVQQKKEWTRTKVDGYSVYDLEGKEQVAAMMAKIQRDVNPCFGSLASVSRPSKSLWPRGRWDSTVVRAVSSPSMFVRSGTP